MTWWDIERGYMRVTMDTNRRLMCTTSSSRTRGEARRCVRSLPPRVHANFSVSTSWDSPHSVPRTTTKEKKSSSRSSSHTHSLPRGSPVGGSFLPCNFNNHILQPLDKMASQDRRSNPPRFFFWSFYQRLLVTRDRKRERCIFFAMLYHLNSAAVIDDKLRFVDN